MAGQLKVGGNIIASHSGVEGAGEVTLQNVTLGDSAVPSHSMNFRNKIINGNFDIWQRGDGPFTTGYSADRWVDQGSGATLSMSKGTFTNGQTDVPGNPKYYMQWSITTGNDNSRITQRIEGVQTFSGETVTLSYWARHVSGTLPSGGIKANLRQEFGTGGTPSSTVYVNSDNISLTSNWQKFTTTFNVPSISGKTIGTDGNDYLGVSLLWQLGNDTTAYSIDIAQVQLEKGSVPTPFEHRPIGTELALCQRYYFKDPASIYYPAILDGNASDYPVAWFYLPVEMRASPTVSALAISSFYYNNGGSTSFVPSGGTPGYSGNRFKGIFVLSQITNSPGSAHAQKLGQWNVQLEFKAEL